MIADWWISLNLIMKILWGITLTASFIFVIQSIMTFVGADTDISSDIDDPSSLDVDPGINLYTFRNFVNFVLGFGWTAILLKEQIDSTAILLFISVVIGCALVAVVMYLFKWLYGMQESGNINVYQSAVGCQGKVYLTIPAERKGMGIVQITIKNAVREYNAVTDENTLPNSTDIRVIEVLNNNTLLVESLNSLIV